MKRSFALMFAILLGVTVLAPSGVEARRERGRHEGELVRRSVVVIRPGHPIRRAMPVVVFRRPAVVVRVAPVRFLPLVVWRTVIVDRPASDGLVWQDAETLSRDDDWAETVFDSDQRGEKLFLEVVAGRVQFDFAEVVFENGDCQVVDFANSVRRPGVYALLDFADGRKIDHVRLIARAKSDEARVALLLRK